MTLFKKLNLKEQREILVFNAPSSFETELTGLSGITVCSAPEGVSAICFSLAFVTKQDELNRVAEKIIAKTEGDAIVWFAYPKRTSKDYNCDFNRDTGWAILGDNGFEAVRQVAIDDNWSALRFRRAAFIKTMKRDPKHALSLEGKKKTSHS